MAAKKQRKAGEKKTSHPNPFVEMYDEQFVSDPVAKSFLQSVAKWLEGTADEPPLIEPLKKKTLIIIVRALLVRCAESVAESLVDEVWSKHLSGQRLKNGRVESGLLHGADVRREALKLFNSMHKKRKLIKEIEAVVKRKLNVSPRTLREWRKSPAPLYPNALRMPARVNLSFQLWRR